MKGRAEERLLQALFSAWRRRGAKLLLIGPEYLRPDFFWEAGFDVSALSASALALEQAREASGPKVEYHLGKADHLPFDDGTFDYVVLAHHLHGQEGTAALAEAVRCADLGVLLLEWNKFSLAALPRPGLWPWTLWRMARKSAPEARLFMRSALPLPRRCWHWRSLRALNQSLSPLPVGALLGIRMELSPLRGAPVGLIKVKTVTPCVEGGVLNREG